MPTQLLDERTVIDYIAGRSDLSALINTGQAHAKEIGDGNLNLLFLVQDGTNGLVVKQTLPYVRSDHSWAVTEDSIFAEARGLDAASTYATRYAPRYFGLDASRKLVVEEDLSQWQVWRSTLNQRIITPYAARDAGRFIADLAYHTSYVGAGEQEVQRAAAAAANPEIGQITEGLIFTEPYYRHDHNSWEPAANDEVEALRRDSVRTKVAELKYEFLTRAEALLHGDLHTNSIFVRRPVELDGDNASETDTNAPHVKVFDFEFGVYGPVSFDLGVLWGNVLLAQAREYALANAGGSEDRAASAYGDWLLSLYTESWNGFEQEFRRLSAHRVNRIFTAEFVGQWIARTLRYAAGFAGAEAVRRTIGWAKVADIETLPTNEKIRATRFALTASKTLIEGFQDIASAQDIRDVVETTASRLGAAEGNDD